MKKMILILGICSLTALTGCNNKNESAADRGLYKKSGNTLNVNDERAELYNEGDRARKNASEDFGYVRHQRSPILGDNDSADHYAAIDREQLANIISKYSTDVPHVDDVSTLVTDEEVLIIYKTDSKNRFDTADQVKKMAMSVVPRWYHVYVSDNTKLRRNVENFATQDSNSRYVESGIDAVIKQMLNSPQGRKMSNGENANGEMQGGTNDGTTNDIREKLKK